MWGQHIQYHHDQLDRICICNLPTHFLELTFDTFLVVFLAMDVEPLDSGGLGFEERKRESAGERKQILSGT